MQQHIANRDAIGRQTHARFADRLQRGITSRHAAGHGYTAMLPRDEQPGLHETWFSSYAEALDSLDAADRSGRVYNSFGDLVGGLVNGREIRVYHCDSSRSPVLPVPYVGHDYKQ